MPPRHVQLLQTLLLPLLPPNVFPHELFVHPHRGNEIASRSETLPCQTVFQSQKVPGSRDCTLPLDESVVMHLTQLSGRLSHILWSRMKLANHNILRWLRQSQSGGEVETCAAAVGAPKVMRALTSLATTRCVFGLLRRSASRRYRDAELIRKAICMAAEAPRMASQIGARTSQQGFTATVRAFIVDFLCCCDREAKPSTSPPNQFVFSTTISSKPCKHNMLRCF